MKFSTKIEYGLVCLVYMARSTELNPVTVKEIVTKEQFAPAFTEKILQKLRQAGIVVSRQGNQGGYVLARSPSEITMKHIVEALEGHTFDVFCDPQKRENIVCTHFSLCHVKPLWHRTKEVLDGFFNTVTLDMIVNNNIPALMGPPVGAAQ